MKLSSLIDIAKQATSTEDKVSLAELYGNFMLGNEQKNYHAIKFENHLIDEFSYLRERIEQHKNLSENEICHVISTPYLQGGHSRLCEKLSSMEDEDSHILVTRKCSSDVYLRLETFFSNIFCISKTSAVDKIVEIACHLSRYKKVVLHIHPDDILTVIAIGVLKKTYSEIKVFFVNHADHLFSYGRSITDVMFLISYRGYEVEQSIKEHLSYNRSFLGIPIDVAKKPRFLSEAGKVLIAGSSYKMKPNSNTSIQNEVCKFLAKKPNSKVVIIGVSVTDYWWWKVKFKYWSRIEIFNSLKYEDYMDLLRSCDSCIDTAPITGGTAFAEMYLNSLRPIAIFSGIYGYTPIDKVRADTLLESEKKECSLLDSMYEDVVRVHSLKSVQQRYLDGLNGGYHPVDAALTGLENDLDLFISKDKANISLDLMRKILKLECVTFFEKMHLIHKYVSLTAFFVKYSKELMKLCK